MKLITCEMCGSTNLMKQDGVFVCQSCGCKYSLEEAKKLMVEGNIDVSGSTVKVDISTELRNLYELARRARADNNSENAQKYYDQIIIKDPSSWEANFYATYYQSMNCKIGEIGVAATRVSNCESTVFNLVKNHITDPSEQRKVVDEIAAKLIIISNLLFNAYKNHYDEIDVQIKSRFVQEYANNCSAARDILYNAGNLIVQIFGDTLGDIAAACWKVGVRQHNILNSVFNDKQLNAGIIKEYNEKILKYIPNYQVPETNMGGGCYIATCVYGSYDCPQVWTLRRYRDDTLASTWCGRLFIRIYYAISPSLVAWLGNKKWFKKIWKTVLDKKTSLLQSKGVQDTPYEDKFW